LVVTGFPALSLVLPLLTQVVVAVVHILLQLLQRRVAQGAVELRQVNLLLQVLQGLPIQAAVVAVEQT
jgi:hypothetical protein